MPDQNDLNVMLQAKVTLLRKLSEDSKRAVQIGFNNGGAMAGALREVPEVPGMFQLRTAMNRTNTNEMMPMDVFFSAADVAFVVTTVDEVIEVPRQPLIVPGRQ